MVEVNRGDHFIHVGRVGTGFGKDVVARLLPKLKAMLASKSPFTGPSAPRPAANIHWVRPDWWRRFSSSVGPRTARSVRLRSRACATTSPQPRWWRRYLPRRPRCRLPPLAPKPMSAKAGASVVMGVPISHPEKAMWPQAGDDGAPVTKLDLARYYEAVGTWMLQHLKGRPRSIIRASDGSTSRPSSSATRFPARPTCWSWSPCRATVNPDIPGCLVFDLDPGPEVAFTAVIEAAKEVRDRLDELGLVSFCKTGGTARAEEARSECRRCPSRTSPISKSIG